jgi:hypothetical protein
MSFIGSASGYVRKWYNQSEGGLDIVASSTATAPLIVVSGAVATSNGIPTLRFDKSRQTQLVSTTTVTLPFQAHMICNPLPLGGAFFKFGNSSSGLGAGIGGVSFTSGSNAVILLKEVRAWCQTNANYPGSLCALRVRESGSNLRAELNGQSMVVSNATSSALIPPNNFFSVGGYTERFASVDISEFITLSESSNALQVIDLSQADYYSLGY